ncbi:MAG TPA: hypothetical protein VGP07_04090 [Polyangia bacterium]
MSGRLRFVAAYAGAITASLVSSCSFDPKLPNGKIACLANSDCPPSQLCATTTAGLFCFDGAAALDAGLAIPDGGADLGAAAGQGGTVAPGTGGAASTGVGGLGAGGDTAPLGGHGPAGNGGSGGMSPGVGGASSSGGVTGAGGMTSAGGGAGGACPSTACKLGDKRCAGGGLETCALVAGCPDWPAAVACGARQTCQGNAPSAQCVCAAPPTGCDPGGATGAFCASATDLETCAHDGDGCVFLAPSTTCTAQKPCTGTFPSASCSCLSDPAICSHATGTFCQSSTQVVTCGRDGSGCLVATPTATCPATKPCGGPVGGAMCTCPAPPSECLSGGAFVAGHVCAAGMLETCGTDVDGCSTMTGSMSCQAPQACQGSLPGAACQCAAVPACAGNESGAHCGDTATLVTCAASGTCQQVSSGSCAALVAEKCVGSYPSAKCEKAFGFAAGDGGSANLGTGLLYGVSVQITTALTLSRLGIVTTAAGPHVRLAIYASDSGGEPVTWMASALPSAAVATGRNEFAINDPPATTPVTLAVGKYWIFATADAATGLAQNGGTTPVRYATWSPFTKAFPTTISSATVTFTKDNLAPADFYVVGVP